LRFLGVGAGWVAADKGRSLPESATLWGRPNGGRLGPAEAGLTAPSAFSAKSALVDIALNDYESGV